MDYRLISVDDHVSEAADTWTAWVPQHFRERVPRVTVIGGVSTWTLNGRPLGGRLAAPKDVAELETRQTSSAFPVRAGDWDARARLRDYELDGVDAAALFPNLATFTGNPCPWVNDDKVLQLACTQAYNDWLLEDFCSVDPQRLLPLALTPAWDVEKASQEAERAVQRGHKGVVFGAALDVFGYKPTWDAYWAPFYSSLEDMGVPLVLHQPSAAMDRAIFHDPRINLPEHIRTSASINHVHSLIYPTVELLMSGILERHPRLRVFLAEAGASWLAYTLHQCDYSWLRRRAFDGSALRMPPSDYFRRQVHVGFWSDAITPALIDVLGEDNLSWEADYLHSIATFPKSQEVVAESLRDVADEAVRRKIRTANAIRLFKLDRS